MAVDLTALTQLNAKRWKAARLTRSVELTSVARYLLKAKARYQVVAAKTGVPWFVIAVIHERESSQTWDRSLAQGDPWNAVSTHVPAGRGPFLSWEDAAIDALTICPPKAARWKDWTPGGALTLLEQYNGLAYANAGRPSPYIWSGTDQYIGGKVLVDHGPIEDIYPSGPRQGQPVVDVQLGCAGLILAMRALDPSIAFTGETAPPVIIKTPPDIPVPPPEPKPEPPQHWFVRLVTAILQALTRKKP